MYFGPATPKILAYRGSAHPRELKHPGRTQATLALAYSPQVNRPEVIQAPPVQTILFIPHGGCHKYSMSKKTLNKDNLTALGAERLADLLLEVSTGSAEIKRRLRLELSHNVGPTELARDVRKRLVSLRKSTSFVGWRKRKSLIKDLNTQLDMITEKIAPEEPTEAFDLLWQFIELAPSVYERVDDSRGDVGDVFRSAALRFEDIGPRAVLDPTALASRVWDALRDNGYGEFDGIIGLLAPTLGKTV